MNFKNLLSFHNEYKKDNFNLYISKHKIINILGLTIKFKQKLSGQDNNINNHIKKLLKNKNSIIKDNKINLINILISIFSSNSELFYIYNNKIVGIFRKDFFKLDKDFIYDFLYYNFGRIKSNFCVLNENSILYKKHINKDKNELFWRYRYEMVHISYMIVCQNNSRIIFKRGNFNNENDILNYNADIQNAKIYDYIKGTLLKKILNIVSYEQQINLLTKAFNFIFENYTNEDNPNYLYYADFQTSNLILDNEGNLNLIDLISLDKKRLITKNDCIYKMLLTINNVISENLFNFFIKKYNLENNFEDCEKRYNNRYDHISNDVKEKNYSLFNKYFKESIKLPEIFFNLINK